MGDQKNLFLAILASLAILLGFQFLFPSEDKTSNIQELEQQDSIKPIPNQEKTVPIARNEIIKKTSRISIMNQFVSGSLALTGARIDDIILKNYYENLEKDSENIKLFSPKGSENSYFAEHGWVSNSEIDLKLPNNESVWTTEESDLTNEKSVTLVWDNLEGLIFKRTFSIDNEYMFTINQTVINNTSNSIILYPYGLISRSGMPETSGLYILHEGPIGVFNDTLKEVDYDDLHEAPPNKTNSTGGWIGISDKYWLAALIPEQNTSYIGAFRHSRKNQQDKYQADFIVQAPQVVAPGATGKSVSRFFAGAKEVHLLDRYEKQLGIARFDLAVDFGWFYFLTKPLFFVLDYFFKLLGNFGLAILLLTVCVKLIFFPLANKSYKAMSKMKGLQPEMTKLRERHGADRQKMNQEMMAMYKREKVNPASGCLPIIVQIPVFFALYKVMFVTIEMRHQPFFGWIHDLSAPDPMYILTLFGAVPWDIPQFLMIGIWPIFMGASMYFQQLLNPQPADPVQAKIFLFMPLFFTFLLGSFPAGLVIYWTWNNILSVSQQWVIMRRMGVAINPT